jgi:hypothetical protein
MRSSKTAGIYPKGIEIYHENRIKLASQLEKIRDTFNFKNSLDDKYQSLIKALESKIYSDIADCFSDLQIFFNRIYGDAEILIEEYTHISGPDAEHKLSAEFYERAKELLFKLAYRIDHINDFLIGIEHELQDSNSSNIETEEVINTIEYIFNQFHSLEQFFPTMLELGQVMGLEVIDEDNLIPLPGTLSLHEENSHFSSSTSEEPVLQIAQLPPQTAEQNIALPVEQAIELIPMDAPTFPPLAETIPDEFELQTISFIAPIIYYISQSSYYSSASTNNY